MAGLATDREALEAALKGAFFEPLALPPADSLLINMVENYLGALKAVGMLDALEKKWFDDGAWLEALP